VALDPAAVGPLEGFTKAMRRYVDDLESSAPHPGDDPPRYPGRREGAVWVQRSREGIPISAETMVMLDHLAVSLSLPCLRTFS